MSAAVALALLGGSCATNPATGKREIMLVSEEQEIALGRQEDQRALAVFDATSGQTAVRGVAAFVRHPEPVFRVVAYTAQARWSRYGGALKAGRPAKRIVGGTAR